MQQIKHQTNNWLSAYVNWGKMYGIYCTQNHWDSQQNWIVYQSSSCTMVWHEYINDHKCTSWPNHDLIMASYLVTGQWCFAWGARSGSLHQASHPPRIPRDFCRFFFQLVLIRIRKETETLKTLELWRTWPPMASPLPKLPKASKLRIGKGMQRSKVWGVCTRVIVSFPCLFGLTKTHRPNLQWQSWQLTVKHTMLTSESSQWLHPVLSTILGFSFFRLLRLFLLFLFVNLAAIWSLLRLALFPGFPTTPTLLDTIQQTSDLLATWIFWASVKSGMIEIQKETAEF